MLCQLIRQLIIMALTITQIQGEKIIVLFLPGKTRIEQYPMDLEVIAGSDAKFTCSGSTDFDEASNMVVYWEKDDKRVSTTENRMTQNFQDNSLTISGTIVRDSGVYACVITNGLDEDRAYAFLTVKGMKYSFDRCLGCVI